MSSQVLTPSTPLVAPHPSSGAHLSVPAKATASSAGQSSLASTRPRRAAAQASRQAIEAATRPTKRRKSQSSASTVKSAASTATTSSSSGLPRTPQVPADYSSNYHIIDPTGARATQQAAASSSRPMAALPRSKRARPNTPGSGGQVMTYNGDASALVANNGVASSRHGNGHGQYLSPNLGNGTYGRQSNGLATAPSSKASIMAGIDTAMNGHTIRRGLHNPHEQQRLQATSVASSSMSRGSATANSIREMIGGQERDVYVIDSISPPAGTSYDHNSAGVARLPAGAKGKRKAPESPMNGVGASPYTPGAGLAPVVPAQTKRRRKDAYAQAQVQQEQAEAQARAEQQQMLSATYDQQQALYAGQAELHAAQGASLGNYRGGYPAGNAYYKQAAEPSGRRQLVGTPGYPAIPPPTQPVNDEDGHYIVREGAFVSEKYQIESLLGQGTFGKVVKCRETRGKGKVAVKIIRAVQKYTDAAKIEVRVLEELRARDPKNENKCIHLLEFFSYLGHVCIVSELLGQSVFDFLKDNQFYPFPPRHIWSFAQQLLKSVAFLHRLDLVHTDLKPENILLVEDEWDSVPTSNRYNAKRRRVLRNTDIRLIDFGSATFNEEYHSQIVSTRHYRAPEIILQMGWSFPCDVWSIGCILVEFYTGDALFQTHENVEHLAMMEAVLGHMPEEFRRKAEQCRPNFFRHGRLDFPTRSTPKQSREFVRKMQPLDNLTRKSPVAYQKHDTRFIHLLKRLLHFDPAQRIKVEQALQHPYFELKEHEIPP